MFKFLKDKLKKAVSVFSKKVVEEDVKEPKEVPEKEEQKKPKEEIEELEEKEEPKEAEEIEEPPEEKEETAAEEVEEPEKVSKSDEELMAEQEEKLQKELEEIKKREKEEQEKKPKEEKIEDKEEPKEVPRPEEPKKKGFLSKVSETFTKKKISQEKFETLFWDLEVAMLENNVAVEVIDKIKHDLSEKLVDTPLTRGKIPQTITNTLKSSIESLFEIPSFKLIEKIKEKKPYIICLVGVNGSGKTTTIAKVAQLFKNNKLDVVIAASDTFRAAAIEQLQKHADKLGIKLIRHEYGSDAAAVAFDAIQNAKAKNRDVVLIDTAGRLHSNANLMDELKKIVRVAKPDLTIFIGESITGNDCIEQAKQFDEAVGIDGIILSKADIDEKGGTAISVSYVTKKPILYLGTGQEYKDLEPFDKNKILEKLGF